MGSCSGTCKHRKPRKPVLKGNVSLPAGLPGTLLKTVVGTVQKRGPCSCPEGRVHTERILGKVAVPRVLQKFVVVTQWGQGPGEVCQWVQETTLGGVTVSGERGFKMSCEPVLNQSGFCDARLL